MRFCTLFVSRHGENQGVIRHASYRVATGELRCRSLQTHAETLRQILPLHDRTAANESFRRLIAFGQTGPTSYQYDLQPHHWRSVRKPSGANRVTVLFNDGFRHHYAALGLLRRITQIMTGGVVFFAASAGKQQE